jgi:signal transduction histidine kinase
LGDDVEEMAQPVCAGEAFRESRESRPHMIFGLSRDVAERPQERAGRKALRERPHRAEKMEALGRLTGGAAHDLNNVLGVACLYAELLQGKMAEDDPLRPYAAQIFTSMEQAAAIIRDLLALSGRELPVSRTVNLDDVVSACLKTPESEYMRGN